MKELSNFSCRVQSVGGRSVCGLPSVITGANPSQVLFFCEMMLRASRDRKTAVFVSPCSGCGLSFKLSSI